MADLGSLYQDLILDHSKRPRNCRALPDANHHADGYNPLCGDKVTLHLRLEGDRISDISFEGSGCAISTASASILTETLKGKTLAEAASLFDVFHDLVTGQLPESANLPNLGKLAVFSGVSQFPVRVKCASLPWHTLRSALGSGPATTTTE